MLKPKDLRFRPYPNALWNWMLFPVVFFVWVIVYCRTQFGTVLPYLCILSVLCLLLGVIRYFIEVYIDSEGMQINCGIINPVSHIKWNQYAQAYILAVSWTSLFRRHIEIHYLLLTPKTVTAYELNLLAKSVAIWRPCGKWKGNMAVRLDLLKRHEIIEVLANHCPVIEASIDVDGVVRL